MKIFWYVTFVIIIIHQSVIFSKSNTYYASGDNVSVRENHDMNSKVICKIRIAQEVIMIQKINNNIIVNNNEGYWCRIKYYNTELRKDQEGWVFSTYLATISDFKPITTFRNNRIIVYYGDTVMTLIVNNNATYTLTYKSNYDTSITKEKGVLLKYNRLIMLKANDQRRYTICYVNKDNNLKFYDCSEDESPCSQ